VVEAYAQRCPHCARALSKADQPEVVAHDHVELPPVRPMVTRMQCHRGVCPACGHFCAPPPAGLESGSPFEPGLCALIIHLHVTQAIGYERLARLLEEVFGLTLSEGADRQHPGPHAGAAAGRRFAAAVRASPVVGSDETSAWVGGKTWWQWGLAVLDGDLPPHHAAPGGRGGGGLPRGRPPRGLGRRPLPWADRPWRRRASSEADVYT
jgi:transposase